MSRETWRVIGKLLENDHLRIVFCWAIQENYWPTPSGVDSGCVQLVGNLKARWRSLFHQWQPFSQQEDREEIYLIVASGVQSGVLRPRSSTRHLYQRWTSNKKLAVKHNYGGFKWRRYHRAYIQLQELAPGITKAVHATDIVYLGLENYTGVQTLVDARCQLLINCLREYHP